MTMETKEVKADVVVIGTGASGLSAALTAARGGAKVMLFEKAAGSGGMTNFAGGMFGVGSKHLEREKSGLTVEQAFKSHMQETHWLADGKLVRAFMDKCGDTIEWLEDLGTEFIPTLTSYAPGGPRTGLMFRPPEGVEHLGLSGRGALVQPLLKQIQAEKNVQILMETTAKKLLMEGGKVVGLVAEDKAGNTLTVRTKAVVIATGGYQDNSEWMEKYCPNGRYVVPCIPSVQTGDGHRMAWEVGAKPEGLGVLQAYSLVVGDLFPSQLTHAAMQPYLWVNKQGERFCDEAVRWDFPKAANALLKQTEATSFTIFDEDTKTYLKEKGVDYGVIHPPTTKLTDLDNEIKRGVKDGKVYQADSLDELAKKIGIDAATLRATVETYNTYCDKNVDLLFAKDRRYLQPVRTPKFYAFKVNVAALITEGGIQINYKTEVVDKYDNPIPGLYAVGCCAGGMTGDTYPLVTGGGSMGFAVTSGRMAGENILKYLGK